jgi:hypothetical protein
MSEKKISPPLTLSAEGSHARTSLTLESGRVSERGREAGFGSSSPESFARWSPDTSSWRTSQLCLLAGSATFSERWPTSGTMRNGIASRLPPLVRHTSETESSSWPTPRATDGDRGGRGDLLAMVRTGRGSRRKHWPTPTGDDANNVTRDSESFQSLTRAVRMWPTPTANEDAAGTPNGKMQRMLGNHPDVCSSGPGTLNPTWVEWLQGLPLGWTEID